MRSWQWPAWGTTATLVVTDDAALGAARRLVEQRGVWVGSPEQRIDDVDTQIQPTDGLLIGVGKRRIVRLRVRP